jgi:hypothetical protein
LFQSGFHYINCQLHRIDCCCEAFNQALVLAFCVFAIEADKFGCFVPIGVPVSTLSESLSFLVSTCRSEGGACRPLLLWPKIYQYVVTGP